jgi:hypothetical protein
MSEAILTIPAASEEPSQRSATPVATAACDECVGSGGWFRYEPSLDPAPGLLYLSCLQCRGSGRTLLARA